MAKLTEATYTKKYSFYFYEPGDKIKPSSKKCPLEDKVHTVTAFSEPVPECGDFFGIIFVNGYKYGVSAEHVLPAK